MNIDLNTKEMQRVVYDAINDAIRGAIHDLFHPEDTDQQIHMGWCIHDAIMKGIDKALCTGPDTMNAIEMGMKRGVEEAMRGTPPIEDIMAFEERLKEMHNAD